MNYGEKLQSNKNKFNELMDKLEFLKEKDKTSENAIKRAEAKLNSVAEILDHSQAKRKLKEVEVLLDAQERLL